MLRKAKGQAKSQLGTTAGGIVWAILITLAGALLLGKLVDAQIMQMGSVGYGAMAVIGFSAWMAAASTIRRTAGNRYLCAAAGSGGYFAVLLGINLLFFGGAYPGFWSGLATALAGAVVAVFTTGQGRGSASRKRYKIPGR